ncbi:MAG: LPS export ABC transporter permease LptG [Gammaproteobacteria bacterium]|nr:LPS export ABC transporter permease LptG [Gammaproteobacteria bacterium]
MRIVERYIARTLVGHITMVLLVLLALYFFSTLMGEMDKTGSGRYSAVEAVIYSLMLLPRQAYELFPLVALVGTIMGIGSLASSNELTVLRAAGVSIRRLALAVMKSGLVLILLVVVMGETVAPRLEKMAHAERLSALARSVSMNTQNGFWARDGQDFIHIRRLLPGGEADGITRYRFDGQLLSEIASARQGRYQQNSWQVAPVTRTLFGAGRVKVQQLAQERWSSSLTPEVVNVAAMSPENLALWELVEFIDYLHENGLAAQRYETAMWVRIFTPLATGGMILLALPFVFGSLRAVTIGQRVMLGSVIGIVFYLVNGMFSRLGLIYDIDPVVSAGTPTLLVYLAWFYLMRRVH